MLEQIAAKVKERVISRSRAQWRAEIESRLLDAPPVRNFKAALSRLDPDFIFEIKRRSPSNGDRPLEIDVTQLGQLYQHEGASCISVLTEPDYFAGSLSDLHAVRQAVQIPVLRKDFIIDELQIAEARAHGADAVLLIVSLLTTEQLAEYIHYCREIEVAALVEIHHEAELEQALAANDDIIGVNNRNLATLEIDLGVGEHLLSLIPSDRLRVAESGISSREDVLRLRRAGADAFLIGSAIMRAEDRHLKIRELLGYDED
ncbi:MAG: indole-3-glycerol phosphate synthase TrpC [bacterium]